MHTTKFHIYPLVGQVALEFEALPCLVFLLMPCSLPPPCSRLFFFSNLFSNLHLFACQNHTACRRQFFLSALPVLLHVLISQAGPGLAAWHGTMLRLKMPPACSFVRCHPDETSPLFGRPCLVTRHRQSLFFPFVWANGATALPAGLTGHWWMTRRAARFHRPIRCC